VPLLLGKSPPPLTPFLAPALFIKQEDRLVKTPLWTDRPEMVNQFGVTENNSLSPEDVAKYMVELITDGKYPGGACLETSIRGARVLGTWNVEAPASHGTAVTKEILEKNYKPILEIMEKERGA
jgi:hypothetical protein